MAGQRSNEPTVRRLTESQAEVEEYWTDERMAQARPVPMPNDPDAYAERVESERDAEPPGSIEPVRPTDEPSGEDADDEDDEPDPGALGSSCPATKVSGYTKFPYCTVGKLFFQANGENYRGSAVAVGDHAVLTAGHCVHNKHLGASSKFKFLPYSPALGRPKYVPTRTHQWPEWVDHENYSYDYAMLHVPTDMSPKIGHLGSKWAQFGPDFTWESIGYPAESPYSGRRMYHTTGSRSSVKEAPGQVFMTNNDMTGGASGGPWLLDGPYANSVNSFRWNNPACHVSGPYFGFEYHDLLIAADALD